jgi:hypothetical protein
MDHIKTRREAKGKGKGPKEKKPYSAKHVRIVEAVKAAKAPSVTHGTGKAG